MHTCVCMGAHTSVLGVAEEGGGLSGDREESKSLTDSKFQIKGFSKASLLAAEDILVKLSHAL